MKITKQQLNQIIKEELNEFFRFERPKKDMTKTSGRIVPAPVPTGDMKTMTQEELETIMICTPYQKTYLWAKYYLHQNFGITPGPEGKQGKDRRCPQ